MSLNNLAGKLVGQYSGPILVVGGAPSVPAELEILRAGGYEPEKHLIISANEHAANAGLKPDYASVNDDVHSVLDVYQEPRMRELMPGTKLLSRHWWADYRTPQLMACNSGMKAILYAAILGANPVIVIGIQNYQTGLYFHANDARAKRDNPNMGRPPSYYSRQMKQVQVKMQGVPVRPVSGPLTTMWKRWDPAEQFGPRPMNELELRAQRDAADQRYIAVSGDSFGFEAAMAPHGMVFAVTANELKQHLRNLSIVEATGKVEDPDGAIAEGIAKGRAELDRMRVMIRKAKNGTRKISRRLYDADLMRIIRMGEAGDSSALIASKTSLPRQQIEYLLKAMGVSVLTDAPKVA